MIESIMAAVDGSDPARAALAWAARLAHRRHAQLDVVHVMLMPQAEVSPATFDALRAAAVAQLDQWIEDAGASGVVAGRIVEVGQASDRIADLAERMKPDLLVLGTGRSDGFTRLGLGSTAHRVVHDYHGPLAAVPGLSRLDDTTQVVVGLDGEKGSERALRWATELSARLTTNPLALFVRDPVAECHSDDDRASVDRLRDAVESQVVAERGCGDLRVLEGDPVEELAGTAAKFPSSILVVGTRSHGLAKHQFLGHVPMELLHHSQRPVVVIPAA